MSFADERCAENSCLAMPETVGGVSHDSEVQVRNIALPSASRPVGRNSEMLLPDEQFTFWGLDRVESNPDEGKSITVEREISETQSVLHEQTIEPIKFRSGKHMIDGSFVDKLRDIINRLGGLDNLRLHFIGHTDNQRLSARARAIYSDNYGLGEFRAKRAADFFREKLGLGEQAVSYEGKGADEPLASNATPAGMAKNRRVEIQVWYDKTTTHFVEEQKFVTAPPLIRTAICRKQAMCQRIERVGKEKRVIVENAVQPIYFDVAKSDIPEKYIAQLRSLFDELQGQNAVQLKFIGHTDSNLLGVRGHVIYYKDNQRLSLHRAETAMRHFQDALGLPDAAGPDSRRPPKSGGAGSRTWPTPCPLRSPAPHPY